MGTHFILIDRHMLQAHDLPTMICFVNLTFEVKEKKGGQRARLKIVQLRFGHPAGSDASGYGEPSQASR